MEFHKRNLIRHGFKKTNLTLDEQYVYLYALLLNQGESEQIVRDQLDTDRIWELSGCWYYNVWPSIIPLLVKINIDDIPVNQLVLPKPSLQLRFAKQSTWMNGITTIQLTNIKFRDRPGSGLGIKWFWGEHHHDAEMVRYINMCTSSDTTIGQELDACCQNTRNFNTMEHEKDWTFDEIKEVLTLICTICLISMDEDLLEHDLLRKDENRDIPLEVKIRRATQRRGESGFHLGRKYHGGPYVVPPHPQRYWVGEGRKNCIIKVRSGYVARKNLMVTIPTGKENA